MQRNLEREWSIIRIVYFILIVFSLFVAVFDIRNVSHNGYTYIFLLPLIYMLIMTFRFIYVPKGIVLKIIDFIYFVKFVILSFMVVYSGWYEGRAFYSPLEQSYNKAIVYMAIEFLFINFFYYCILRKVDINLKDSNLNFKLVNQSKDVVYKMFLILNCIFLIFSYKNLSFLGLGHKEVYSDPSQILILFTISLYISKYFLLAYIIRYFYIKYKRQNQQIFIFYTVCLALIICSIFVGSNRMDAILPLVSLLILLNYLYKNRMNIYNLIIVSFGVISLYLISLIRKTFDYQITESKSGLITDYLQVYIAGVYNTAIGLELGQSDNKNVLITFLYDLIRPFLGLNFFWRSETIKTSAELFNFKIYGVGNHVTQIIPLIAQFNLPFGWFGIPISVFIITVLLYLFLRILKNIYIIEAMIILPIIVRLCVTYFQNISIFINELSSIIIIFGFLKICSILLIKLTNK